MSNDYPNLVRRAALPEILFVPDLALALQVSKSAARKAIRRGECGAYFRLGRRLAVRRVEFLRAVTAREQRGVGDRGPVRSRSVPHRRAGARGRRQR